VFQLLEHLSGERVELLQGLDLVPEEDGAVGGLGVCGEHLQGVAPHAKRAAPERLVVARVLDVDQLSQRGVAVEHLPLAQQLHHPVVLLG
jgi:hypothetical protein